ncbi:MAG: hypothetical protein GYA17_07250 [Chloroflexi bacterium]|nr:hypothetical protein [Chloroflexota bacterium]
MDEQRSSFDFEHYQPRESTAIPTPRRGLLRAMLSELEAYNDQVDGKPTLKIADLASLPDEELAQIRPVRQPECKISLRDGLVWARPAATLDPVVLFPVDAPALAAFNLFDGKRDLREVSQALAGPTRWPPEKCWAYTRGLFLKLANQRVCVPK